MGKVKNIDDIIHDEIHAKINTSIVVESITSPVLISGEWFQDVTFCNDKWLLLLDEFKNPNITFEITEKLPNGVYKVILPFESDGFTPIEIKRHEEFKIANFFYFRGTQRGTNEEWVNFSNDERDKLPMTWLSYSPRIRQSFKSDTSQIEREADLRIFFAHGADFANDLTKDHINKNIIPLNQMVHAFIEAIKDNSCVFFSNELEYTTYEFPKFGIDAGMGSIANILDSNLSAVELRLTLPINKGSHCYC